jgi:hypothetical protein
MLKQSVTFVVISSPQVGDTASFRPEYNILFPDPRHQDDDALPRRDSDIVTGLREEYYDGGPRYCVAR